MIEEIFSEGYALCVAGVSPDFHFRCAVPPFELWHSLFSQSNDPKTLLRFLAAKKSDTTFSQAGFTGPFMFLKGVSKKLASIEARGIRGGQFVWQVAFEPFFRFPQDMLALTVPGDEPSAAYLQQLAPGCPLAPTLGGTWVRLMFNHEDLGGGCVVLNQLAMSPSDECLVPPMLLQNRPTSLELIPQRLRSLPVKFELARPSELTRMGLETVPAHRPISGDGSIISIKPIGERSIRSNYPDTLLRYGSWPGGRPTKSATTQVLIRDEFRRELPRDLICYSAGPQGLWLTPVLPLTENMIDEVERTVTLDDSFEDLLLPDPASPVEPKRLVIAVPVFASTSRTEAISKVVETLNRAIAITPRHPEFVLDELQRSVGQLFSYVGCIGILRVTLRPISLRYWGSSWVTFTDPVAVMTVFTADHPLVFRGILTASVYSRNKLRTNLYYGGKAPDLAAMAPLMPGSARFLCPIPRTFKAQVEEKLIGFRIIERSSGASRRLLSTYTSSLFPSLANADGRNLDLDGFFAAFDAWSKMIHGTSVPIAHYLSVLCEGVAGSAEITSFMTRKQFGRSVYYYGLVYNAESECIRPLAGFQFFGKGPVVYPEGDEDAWRIFNQPGRTSRLVGNLMELKEIIVRNIIDSTELLRPSPIAIRITHDVFSSAVMNDPIDINVPGALFEALAKEHPQWDKLYPETSLYIWRPEALRKNWHALALRSMTLTTSDPSNPTLPAGGRLRDYGLVPMSDATGIDETSEALKVLSARQRNGQLNGRDLAGFKRSSPTDPIVFAQLPGMGWIPVSGYLTAAAPNPKKLHVLTHDAHCGLVRLRVEPDNFIETEEIRNRFHPNIRHSWKYSNTFVPGQDYTTAIKRLFKGLSPWKLSNMTYGHAYEGRLLLVKYACKYTNQNMADLRMPATKSITPKTGSPLEPVKIPVCSTERIDPTGGLQYIYSLDPRGLADAPMYWYIDREGDTVDFYKIPGDLGFFHLDIS